MKKLFFTSSIMAAFLIAGLFHHTVFAEQLYQYMLTSASYSDQSDYESIVKAEFGPDAEVGDFAEIKREYTGKAAQFGDALGLVNYRQSALCYYNGAKFYRRTSDGLRSYYMQRHNGNPPSNFLVHDHIDNHTLSLGSWYDRNLPIIARIPKEEVPTYTLTLHTGPPWNAWGSVTANPDKDRYEAGEKVQIWAQAKYDEGYRFGGWSNDAEGQEAKMYITMDRDKVITANFVRQRAYDTPGGKTSGEVLDPVNTGTGEYYFEARDLDMGGAIPLRFDRYYASGLHNAADISRELSHVLGENWLHNYLLKIVPNGEDHLKVLMTFGNILDFEKSDSGEWELSAQNDIPYQLKQGRNQKYYLIDPYNDRIYIFDTSCRLEAIKDRQGNTLSLTYNADGELDRIEDGLGRYLTFSYQSSGGPLTGVCGMENTCIVFTYGATGPVTGFTDPLGHTTRYEYENEHAMVKAILPRGNVPYTQEYNATGKVIRQTDALNNASTLAYSETDNELLTRVTYPDGTVIGHTHQGNALLTGVTDTAGNAADMVYDVAGRRTGLVDRLAQETRRTFHTASGKIASETDTEGNTTTYTYTASSRNFEDNLSFTFYDLIRIDFPDGSRVQMTYDENGNMTRITDPNGHSWQYTYDTDARMISSINPAGGTKTFAYNPDGSLSDITDKETGTTKIEYDRLKRPTRIIHPDGTRIETRHDALGRIRTITNETGGIWQYEYDENGNLAKTTDPLGSITSYIYDDMDRIRMITGPLQEQYAVAYDSMGHLDSLTLPSGRKMSYTYDPNGYPVTLTGPGDDTHRIIRDKEGVIQALQSPSGTTTSFETNRMGRIVKVIDPTGAETLLQYDVRQRLVHMMDAMNRNFRYHYDASGRLTDLQADGWGTAKLAWNSLGQVRTLTDFNGQDWVFTHSDMGRLQSHTDPLGNTWAYTYNSRGRIDQVTLPDGAVQENSYDASGKLLSRSFTDGTRQAFTYDASGRLVAAGDTVFAYDNKGRLTETSAKGASFTTAYNLDGNMTRVTYGNRLTVSYQYDSQGRLQEVRDDAGNTVAFQYDPDGRVTAINRSNGVNTDYTLDTAGRIVSIHHGNLLKSTYQLDASGALVGSAQDGFSPAFNPSDVVLLRETAYDAASQIQLPGYGYDACGRLISGAGSNFEWNNADLLIQKDGMAFEYNDLGNLTSMSAMGTETVFHYNPALRGYPVVAEQNGISGQWGRHYVYTPEGELLYSIGPSQGDVRFYHFDRLGSTALLTNAAGDATDFYAYLPYGALIDHQGDSDQPFQFIGQYGVMHLSGLLYMRARWYDPQTARFLNRDPQWLTSGNLLEANPYLYAHANPLSYIDPMGTAPSWLSRVGSFLLGLKPNKEQLVDNVGKGTYENFIPGGSSYAQGDAPNKMIATAVKDVTIGPAIDKINFWSNLLETICDYGQPETKGVWNYGHLYSKYYRRYKNVANEDTVIPKIQGHLEAVTSYGRDAVSLTARQTAWLADRTSEVVVNTVSNVLAPDRKTQLIPGQTPSH